MPGVVIQPNFHLIARRRGRIVAERHVANAVYSAGRNAVRDLLLGRAQAPRYIALGGDYAGAGGELPLAPATDGTSLASEMQAHRWEATKIRVGDAAVVYDLFIFEQEGNETGYYLYEAGLFAGTGWRGGAYGVPYEGQKPYLGGTMLARATFAPLLKTEDVTLTIAWEFSVASATT
jgi:hypothetical protein